MAQEAISVSKNRCDEIQARYQGKIKTALDRVSGKMEDTIKSSFPKQGARLVDRPWKKTSVRGLALRKSFPYGRGSREAIQYIRSAKTLIDTGALMNSIKAKITQVNPNWVMSVGSAVDYAALQNFGGDTTVVNPHTGIAAHITVPARRFMYLNKPDQAVFVATMREGLK